MQRRTKATIAAAAALCAGASAVPLAAAPERLPAGPRCVPPDGGTGCLPLAPPGARVDLERPSFSRPTAITNPLFPISRQHSVLLLGRAGGASLRVEVTLLPGTKAIAWGDRRIRTRISQYVAFHDGRIEEVALDWYAQADDGAVWYLGEDVYNYQRGAVADREGTWIAGRDGPGAMIMPGRPRVGDVFRPENAPGIVFERSPWPPRA